MADCKCEYDPQSGTRHLCPPCDFDELKARLKRADDWIDRFQSALGKSEAEKLWMLKKLEAGEEVIDAAREINAVTSKDPKTVTMIPHDMVLNLNYRLLEYGKVKS